MPWRLVLTVLWLASPAQAAEPVTGRLAPCPPTPNCVSSDAADAAHRVAPFELALPAADAWRLLGEAVRAMPRTTVTEATDVHLRAECRSLVFRFVDDLELELRAGEGLVAVRSASRVGYSDFGVNRRRVEHLREALRSRGVVK